MYKWRLSVNTAKNLVIAALVILALFLGGETGLPGEIFAATSIQDVLGGIFGGGTPLGTSEDDLPKAALQAAKPLFISVNSAGEDGIDRYGVKYDGKLLDSVYSKYSAVLGEALGSSGDPQLVPREHWEKALQQNGVFFDYLYDQPLELLAQWLGTNMNGGAAEHFARRICLSHEGKSLVLYYYSSDSGNYYRCDTAQSPNYVLQRIQETRPNGSHFAYEQENNEHLDPDTMFIGGITEDGSLTVKNPIGKTIDANALLEVFAINSYVARRYESDGTTVYVEGEDTLRISSSGGLSFQSAPESGIPLTVSGELPTMAEAVEAARILVQSSAGAVSGEAELWLSGVVFNPVKEEYTISFGYIVGGMPVQLSGSSAAVEITVRAQHIVKAEMILREYSFSGETSAPYPEHVSAAALSPGDAGEPLLVYYESGDRADLKWINASLLQER